MAYRILIGLVVIVILSIAEGHEFALAQGNKSDSMTKLFDNIKLAPQYKKIGQGNPLMTQRFSADPSAMEYNGRVYVYSTHDSENIDASGVLSKNTYGQIKTINCISSDDMVNWTDHGVIQVAKSGSSPYACRWANNSWAPAAAHKTVGGSEKFFLYFADNASGIGVLTSDTPVGPWLDPIGRPLVSRQTPNCKEITWLFDPAVLVDDDGKAYLYFGGGVPQGKDESPGTVRVVELGSDMVSLVGTPKVIDAPWLFEDSGINKIGDTYYYSYCSNWSSRDNAVGPYVPDKAEIIYMTGPSPFGPWTYRGAILKNPGTFFGCYGNNHHSLMKFKDKWFMFYHSEILNSKMNMPGGYRCIQVDEVKVNKDGTISPITATYKGVKQLSNLNPYVENEAETFAWMGGITTSPCAEPSSTYGKTNLAVVGTNTGDWIGLSKVDFGTVGASSFTAKVASGISGNVIKICLDKLNGEAIGYLEVSQTGSDKSYTSVTIDIKKITGVHDLFFVFAGDGFRFDSWRFEN